MSDKVAPIAKSPPIPLRFPLSKQSRFINYYVFGSISVAIATWFWVSYYRPIHKMTTDQLRKTDRMACERAFFTHCKNGLNPFFDEEGRLRKSED